MIHLISYKNERYRVEGTKRTGFIVFKFVNRHLSFMGKSQTETAKMAVIDVIRNEYSSYY